VDRHHRDVLTMQIQVWPRPVLKRLSEDGTFRSNDGKRFDEKQRPRDSARKPGRKFGPQTGEVAQVEKTIMSTRRRLFVVMQHIQR